MASAASEAAALALEWELPRDEWVPDSQSSSCMLCDNKFGFTRTKHHCRRCGLLLCHKCSPNRVLFPAPPDDPDAGTLPHRICNPCFRETTFFQKFKTEVAPVLTQNLAALHGSVPVRLYDYKVSRDPFDSYVWLGEGLDIVCWLDPDGNVESTPVYGFDGVETGIMTFEFERREQRVRLCCFASEDTEFTSREDCFLSLLFTSERTIDMEFEDSATRKHWEGLWRELGTVLPFASWHQKRGTFSHAAAARREKVRVEALEERRSRHLNRANNKTLRRTATERLKHKYGALRKGYAAVP